MRRFLTLFTVLMLSAALASAQTQVVTGRITDENGNPVARASVQEKKSKNGTITDANGNFSLSTTRGTTLVVSNVGYDRVEIVVGSSTSLAVSLRTINQNLTEVVVTALGISRNTRSVGAASTTLQGSELIKAREANVVNSLAGKVSGVRINSQSGTLGGSARIIIRGASSFDGNNQPLFVIDGFPVTNSSAAGGTIANNVDFGNRAGDINPDDIETMTILKGAAAAGLYGSLAKNGAIIITTKRGKKNSKSSVSFNSSIRFDKVLMLPTFQNEYAQGNYGVYDLKNSNGWGPKISGVQDITFKDFLGRDVVLHAYPDNVENFFNTGTSYINNIGFSGGGDNSDYRLSFTSLNEKGIIPETKLDRYTISLNAGRDFSDKLSSRVALNYTKTQGIGRPAQASNNANVITSAVYGLPRTVNITDVRDNVLLPVPDPITGPQRFLTTDKTGNNPYWIQQYNKNNNYVDRIVGTATLSYKPISWLTITDNLGTDFYTENRYTTIRNGTAGTLKGSFTTSDVFARRTNNDLIITAEKKVKDFSLKLLAGNNILDRFSRGNAVSAIDLTVPDLYTYSNAATRTPDYAYAQQRLVALYGEFDINYKNYAFITVTGRNDFSSTLPKENNSYFYPSVTGSFIFSDLIKQKWLSYGKLRFGYASVGSDEAPYQLNFQYTGATGVFVQYIGTTTVFPFGGITTPYGGPATLPPVGLQPQKQNTVEIGTDLKFLSNRIGLSFTYYNTLTQNQIVSITVPTSTGYNSQRINAGGVRNKGIELDLNLVPFKGKNLGWTVDVNFSQNKQTVESLSGSLKEYTIASGYSSLVVKALIGGSFALYGTGWARDPDGNIIIDQASGLRTIGALKNFGSVTPKWIGGVRNSLTFKNFTFDFLVDVRKGGVFYSGTVAGLRASGLAIETLENRDKVFVDKGVYLDGTGKYVANTVPVQSMQDFWGRYSAVANTEGNIFDASFVKLREMRISYALPQSIFKNGLIKGAEFGLEGRNLWLIKSYVPHVDPELNFFGAGSVGEGVEFNSIPSTRSIGLNLRLSF
ncbi:MAG TPA: SusC/RagA family TonB-linked outer membrane protein [Chitinophagaceae bacterium]